LDKLAPGEDEWSELNSEHQKLSHAQALIDAVQQATQALSEAPSNAQDLNSAAIDHLQHVAEFDAELTNIIDVLQSAQAQLQDAGHSLSNYLNRTDIPEAEDDEAADTVGVMGLSFMPVFVACAAWNVITRFVAVYRGEGTSRTRLDLTLALVLMLVWAGYGLLKVTEKPSSGEKVRVTLVQPNVAQADGMNDPTGELARHTYQRLRDFTRLYAKSSDLIVWPESSLPLHLNYDLAFHEEFFKEALGTEPFSLLAGTEIRLPREEDYVSALLMRGSLANRQEHHKVHLVPFGEYLPLGEYWESLGGTWGGRFDLNRDGIAKDDANHFSLAFDGRK
jgi:hypothetical protein